MENGIDINSSIFYQRLHQEPLHLPLGFLCSSFPPFLSSSLQSKKEKREKEEERKERQRARRMVTSEAWKEIMAVLGSCRSAQRFINPSCPTVPHSLPFVVSSLSLPCQRIFNLREETA